MKGHNFCVFLFASLGNYANSAALVQMPLNAASDQGSTLFAYKNFYGKCSKIESIHPKTHPNENDEVHRSEKG